MKLPLNWLKDYVQIPKDPKILMDKLTAIGHMQDGPAKNIAGDIVYDLEIRQNRSDCLSILGLAREAGAVLDVPVAYPAGLNKTLHTLPSNLEIHIENPEHCYRFNVLTFENIKIGPSPEWLSNKLEAYGIKSINNLVDITNFVMVETGEPMHAYDARSIHGNINVRLAKKDEKLTVLGEKKLVLTNKDLVIADDEKALALAGIIGGEYSGIQEDTTKIILEDATYNQASIRRTSIRHSIRTEASTRHEKFLHTQLSEIALNRAAELITDLCQGKMVGYTQSYPKKESALTVEMRISHLKRLGGINLSLEESQQILKKLEIPSEKISSDKLIVTVPYWRTDIAIEADVIEEVLRIYGYDNIPATLPDEPVPANIQSFSYEIDDKIRDIMIAAGFDEQITEPLTNEEHSVLEPIVLQNSLNADKTMLRTNMKSSLLKAYQNQLKHRKTDIRLFETGKIYYKKGTTYHEEKILAGMSSYHGNSYSQIKGVIEVVFERLGYEINENIYLIEMLDKKTFYFEIKINDIISQAIRHQTAQIYTTPPQLIFQDFSFYAPQEIKVGEVIETIRKTSPYVQKVSLGEEPLHLKDNKKTIFIKVAFYSKDKALSNEDVEPERKKIIETVQKKYQLTIR